MSPGRVPDVQGDHGEGDWRAVWAAVDRWRESQGWTWQRVYSATGISDATFGAMKRLGQPIKRSDKIVDLVDGLGWSRSSIDDVLAGGQPTVVSPPRPDGDDDDIARLTRLVARVDAAVADLAARVEALELRLGSTTPPAAARPR